MKTVYLFRNIRNRIKKHNGLKLLYELLKLTNHPDATNIDRLIHYPLWSLLLLVKWTILHGEFKDTYYQKDITKSSINELINKTSDLPVGIRKPSEYHNLLLFMRNVAFQQFWIQEPFTQLHIARQYELFARLESNHLFQKMFVDVVGISINDFIELSIALITYSITKKSMEIPTSWFSSIEHAYAPNTVRNFLNGISLDLENARQWLIEIENAKDDRVKVIDYEFYEQSPFLRYPLIRRGEAYFCISPILLQYSLGTFIYDTLRNTDIAAFMDKFGSLFEKLVGRSLQLLSSRMVLEAELMMSFENEPSQKVVDFLLLDNGNNIFLDAKGVAMSWIGMVTHLPGTVRNHSKNSILKGIDQAYALAQRISSEQSIANLQLGRKNNYLLIVTFKELYIGNGRTFRDFIAPDEIDKIINSYGKEWIPLSNIYFISIDDLDILVACVKQSGNSISTILEHAVKSDQIPETMKFVFRQHILELCPDVDLAILLQNSFEAILNLLRNRMERGNR